MLASASPNSGSIATLLLRSVVVYATAALLDAREGAFDDRLKRVNARSAWAKVTAIFNSSTLRASVASSRNRCARHEATHLHGEPTQILPHGVHVMQRKITHDLYDEHLAHISIAPCSNFCNPGRRSRCMGGCC